MVLTARWVAPASRHACTVAAMRSRLPSPYSTLPSTPMASGSRPASRAAARQHVDGGGLLGDQCRLPLRKDEYAADELQPADAGEEGEQGEGFVERVVHVVGTRPARMGGGVGAEDVVVGEHVAVAGLLDG